MSSVSVRGLHKFFGDKARVVAVDDLDLTVEDGELLVLLGPSGCGKTTTLRCIAGLETADRGTIQIGTDTVHDSARRISVPANRRDIGMVFQSYALWPHKTVRQNIAYPLQARRRPKAEEQDRVNEVAALVQCGNLLERYPSQLSGGQQQRVALARGLAARPGVVLFDEPLSNLDALLRDQVRTDLHELHRRIGYTGIYVTHDQREALAVADRMAVMRTGRIEQIGTAPEVFNTPATNYVADFLGYVNAIDLDRVEDSWRSGDCDVSGCVPVLTTSAREIVIRARAEDVLVLPPGGSAPDNFVLSGLRVADSVFAGRQMEVVLASGDLRLRTRVPATTAHELTDPGMPVSIAISPTHCHVFSRETGSRIDSSWTTSREGAGVAPWS